MVLKIDFAKKKKKCKKTLDILMEILHIGVFVGKKKLEKSLIVNQK